MAKKHHLSDGIKHADFAHTILSYSDPSVSEKDFLALKNGQISWQSELNLSNFTSEKARQTLASFIQNEAKKNNRCVLIILDVTPKTLPLNLVCVWLSQFNEVHAFHNVPEKKGIYVLLKNTQVPSRLPEQRGDSFLVEETRSMERKRRLVEQDGERKLARVNARQHPETEISNGPEEAPQNGILQHPELDNQRFDGIDPNLNPEPPLNSEARREYDNEKRNQEQEKQLRLGNMPKFTSAPTPRGPQ